jgi:hypothetical protein
MSNYYGYDERNSISENSEKEANVNAWGVDEDFLTLNNVDFDSKYEGDEAKREEQKKAWLNESNKNQVEMDNRSIEVIKTSGAYKEYYDNCAVNPDCYAECNYKDTDELKRDCGTKFNEENKSGGSKKKIHKKRKTPIKPNKSVKKCFKRKKILKTKKRKNL